MGIYLNPSRVLFEQALRSDIFVDKSEMIRYLNSVLGTEQKYVSVSRPRRFGKSMAVNMLCAYYGQDTDSRPLFEKCLISRNSAEKDQRPWDEYLGKFDVIRLMMTEFLDGGRSIGEMLAFLSEEVFLELAGSYPEISFRNTSALSLVLKQVYARTHRQFVVMIDEWDAPFRVFKEDNDGQKAYLDFLRNLLKDQEYVALAYMTGILPIKKYGQHSALNMFFEYSMVSPMQMAEYTGFTEREVRELCGKYRMKYEDISNWYDGYLVSGRIPVEKRDMAMCESAKENQMHLYSPLSVVNALRTGKIQNYWNNTETYEALAEYIRMDYDGLKDAVALLMDGGRIAVDLGGYQNDMTTFHSRDDVFALLIHLGYLGYNEIENSVFIPNQEVMDVFRSSTKTSEWIETFSSFSLSRELLQATWSMNQEKVAEILEIIHNKTENKTYNSEATLSYAIQYAYYSAEKYYTKILELGTGKGYADLVYLPSPDYPDKPVLLIELKHDKNADTAVSQIHRQRYPDRLEHYKGNILLVGINYSTAVSHENPTFKHHTCLIERA